MAKGYSLDISPLLSILGSFIEPEEEQKKRTFSSGIAKLAEMRKAGVEPTQVFSPEQIMTQFFTHKPSFLRGLLRGEKPSPAFIPEGATYDPGYSSSGGFSPLQNAYNKLQDSISILKRAPKVERKEGWTFPQGESPFAPPRVSKLAPPTTEERANAIAYVTANYGGESPEAQSQRVDNILGLKTPTVPTPPKINEMAEIKRGEGGRTDAAYRQLNQIKGRLKGENPKLSPFQVTEKAFEELGEKWPELQRYVEKPFGAAVKTTETERKEGRLTERDKKTDEWRKESLASRERGRVDPQAKIEGEERKASLAEAKHNYEAIQREIERRYSQYRGDIKTRMTLTGREEPIMPLSDWLTLTPEGRSIKSRLNKAEGAYNFHLGKSPLGGEGPLKSGNEEEKPTHPQPIGPVTAPPIGPPPPIGDEGNKLPPWARALLGPDGKPMKDKRGKQIYVGHPDNPNTKFVWE